VHGNSQQMSLSSHLIDPGYLDPGSGRPEGTTVSYRLYKDGQVQMRIYNASDACLYRTINVGYQSMGFQSYQWDGLDDYGYPVPQGMYCIEVWYVVGNTYEFIGSVWPDPETYLPLGVANGLSGSLTASGNGRERQYRVWSPTDGKLQIKVSGPSGAMVYLRDTAKKTFQVLRSTALTGPGNWCLIDYTPTEPRGRYYYVWVASNGHSGTYSVRAQFYQSGDAAVTPWNSWYWPTGSTEGDPPHLYDTGGSATPLKKLDSAYGGDCKSRNWEATNAGSGPYWWGHCWGWTIASVLTGGTPPDGQTKNGQTFSRLELKGLLCQLFDGKQPKYHNGEGNDTYFFRPGSQTPDQSEYYAGLACKPLHELLYYALRRNGKAVHMNATHVAGSVWNHPVYRYVCEMTHPSTSPAERQRVKCHTQITMGADCYVDIAGHYHPPSDSAFKTEWFDYEIWFWKDPKSQPSVVMPISLQPHAWLDSSLKNKQGFPTHGYTPESMSWPTGMAWGTNNPNPGAYNPHVSKARVYGIWTPPGSGAQ